MSYSKNGWYGKNGFSLNLKNKHNNTLLDYKKALYLEIKLLLFILK